MRSGTCSWSGAGAFLTTCLLVAGCCVVVETVTFVICDVYVGLRFLCLVASIGSVSRGSVNVFGELMQAMSPTQGPS